MSLTAIFEEILYACGQEGCPLCRLQHDADLRYLDRLLYDQVNDYETRQQLRASLGFCEEHGALAINELQGNALGLAIIYEDLLRIALEQLATTQSRLKIAGNCPACKHRADMNRRVLAELSLTLMNDSMQAALRNSQGLCFTHLRQALESLRAPEKRNSLLELQRGIMEKLRAELAEFIRKNDYRFTDEPFGPERDSWRRAVRLTRKP